VKIDQKNTLIFLLLIIPLLVFLLAMNGEDKRPVMEYVIKISDWQHENSHVVKARFIGKKQRNCERVKKSEKGHVNFLKYPAEFNYLHDATPDSSYPKGIIDIGWIEWRAPDIIEAQRVGFSMYHDCEGIHRKSIFWFELD
jgi:hypothetical protein